MNINRALIILHMKRFILLFIAVSFFLTNTESQQKKPDLETAKAIVEASIKKRVDKMETMLSLDNNQKKRIQAIEEDINEQFSKRIMKVLGDFQAQTDINFEFDKIRLDKYKPVLTDDQFKVYKEYWNYADSMYRLALKLLPDSITQKR